MHLLVCAFEVFVCARRDCPDRGAWGQATLLRRAPRSDAHVGVLGQLLCVFASRAAFAFHAVIELAGAGAILADFSAVHALLVEDEDRQAAVGAPRLRRRVANITKIACFETTREVDGIVCECRAAFDRSAVLSAQSG